MKWFAILFFILSYSITGFSQNRIHSWDAEKISSIQIEVCTNNMQNALMIFDSKKEIDKIILFLKEVDFVEFTELNNEIKNNEGSWKYRLSFLGLRDQVYLFDEHAFIGKTSYLIGNKVIQEFTKLLDELKN